MEATATPQVRTPRPVTVMGAGEEIRDVHDLKRFHTPIPTDGGVRNYHAHSNLTPHYQFAKAVMEGCAMFGIKIDDIAFKVDGVQRVEIPLAVGGIPLMGTKKVDIANRFFLIARIQNQELQVADDVETYIIARNSHDKRIPMELAIGNRVIVCSNLMFGGDIHIKSKNTRFGFAHFNDKMRDLFIGYKEEARNVREDIQLFKDTRITPAIAHQFIGRNASNNEFIQPGRVHRVHQMFLEPEHREYYQTYPFNNFPEERLQEFSEQENPPVTPREDYTLWRLLNAYTYVHRGELCIDKETGEPYAKDHAKYESRSNVCPLPLKKRYTAALWSALKTDLT